MPSATPNELDTAVLELTDRATEIVSKFDELLKHKEDRIHRLLIGANAAGFAATFTLINSSFSESSEHRIGVEAFVVLLLFLGGSTIAAAHAFLVHNSIEKDREYTKMFLNNLLVRAERAKTFSELEVALDDENNKLAADSGEFSEAEKEYAQPIRNIGKILDKISHQGLSSRQTRLFHITSIGCFLLGLIVGLTIVYVFWF